jgi:hypothetical protein
MKAYCTVTALDSMKNTRKTLLRDAGSPKTLNIRVIDTITTRAIADPEQSCALI